MAKFRVKVQRVQGINKNTYVAGEIVYDYNFPEGNAKKLLEEGKIELIETKAETIARIKAEKEANEAAAKAKADKEKEKADAKAKEEADALIKAEKEANEKAEKEAK